MKAASNMLIKEAVEGTGYDAGFNCPHLKLGCLDQVIGVVDRLHDWHRTEEIPRTTSLIEQAQAKFTTGINQQDLLWLESELTEMKARIVMQVADPVANLLATLTDDQINHFEVTLENHNKEEEEELNLPLDEWTEFERKQVSKELEDWLGYLDDAQMTDLLNAYQFDRGADQRHHEQSIETQKRFVALLRSRPAADEIKSNLIRWLLETDIFQSDDYKSFRKQQRTQRALFYLKLDRSITTQQRQSVLSRLESYQKDLESIHGNS